jgi:hypothetical protein
MCNLLLASDRSTNDTRGRCLSASNFSISGLRREAMLNHELGFCGEGLGIHTQLHQC